MPDSKAGCHGATVILSRSEADALMVGTDPRLANSARRFEGLLAKCLGVAPRSAMSEHDLKQTQAFDDAMRDGARKAGIDVWEP